MKRKPFRMTFNLALFLIWVVIFLFIGFRSPYFFKPTYLISTMLRNIVEIGMVALPMTMIILTGGIDLSVGNILVLACMLGGMAAEASGSSAAGIAVIMLVGLVCGLINGIVITKAKIPPMITTLSTMYLYLGLARGISQGNSVYSFPAAAWMGNTIIGSYKDPAQLPVQIIFYIVLAVIFVIVVQRSTYGRKLFAIGLNENAVRYSGIDTDKIKIIAYTVCGLVCAFASIIWLGRFTSVKYDAGTSFNLKVITVVVLGGTSINGGVGDMKGTLLATLIIATLNSGLTVMNIPIDAQTIIQGVVLLISLIAFSIASQRARQRKVIKVVSENTPEKQ